MALHDARLRELYDLKVATLLRRISGLVNNSNRSMYNATPISCLLDVSDAMSQSVGET